MQWKRKKGRRSAQGAGCIFKVSDDGSISIKSREGEWTHGKEESPEKAVEFCERWYSAHSALYEFEALKRAEVAEAAAVMNKHRRMFEFTARASKLVWEYHRAHEVAQAVLMRDIKRAPEGFARTFILANFRDEKARELAEQSTKVEFVSIFQKALVRHYEGE